MSRLHKESHLVSRIGWLRAAVLGANDGIVSTASLIVGVASASAATSRGAGRRRRRACRRARCRWRRASMSRSVRSPTPRMPISPASARNWQDQPEFEREELAQIYVKRGLEVGLARQVADQLMAKDALGAHARDELGISEITTARPIQAALTSAATFSVGAALPLLMVLVSPASMLVWPSRRPRWCSSLCSARSAPGPAAPMSARRRLRVTFWGAFAMALTAGIGALVGTAV